MHIVIPIATTKKAIQIDKIKTDDLRWNTKGKNYPKESRKEETEERKTCMINRKQII